MRRLAAVAAFVMVAVALPGGGAAGQVTNERPVPHLNLHIRGFQILGSWWLDVESPRVRRETPVYWFAEFLSTPAGPISVDRHPKTYWLRAMVNHDPVEHKITQCGAAFTAPECVLVPDSRVTVTLSPGGQADAGDTFRFDDFAEGQALVLTCEIHRWMRGRVTKETFFG